MNFEFRAAFCQPMQKVSENNCKKVIEDIQWTYWPDVELNLSDSYRQS